MLVKDLPPQERRLIDRIVDSIANDGDSDDLAEMLSKASDHVRTMLLVYWDIRKSGTSPKLAEMLTLQSPPMSNTDREFLEGHCNGNQFAKGPLSEDLGDRMKAVAEAAGQNVKGKVYIGGLARFPGDPEAWIAGRGDVRKVVEERGWKCSGSVDVTPDSRRDDAIIAAKEAPIVSGPGLSLDD